MLTKNNNIPLYIQIKELIITKILSGELLPGDQLWSEFELAKELDVSRLTVRKAYSELTKNGTLVAIRGKGTFVSNSPNTQAMQARQQNSFNIGIIFPETTTFFGKILNQIEAIATEHNHNISVMFNYSIDKEDQAVKAMISKKVDGIILSPHRTGRADEWKRYKLLNDSGIPYVMIGKPPVNVMCDAVYPNDQFGGFYATKHLADNGHTNILHLYNSIADTVKQQELILGYTSAMNFFELEENIHLIDVHSGTWQQDLTALFKSTNPPTAVFCDDNLTATLLTNMMQPLGLSVPNDCEIIGYGGNNNYPGYDEYYSSLALPKAQMAELAFDTLIRKLTAPMPSNQEVYNRHILVNPRLDLHASTK